MAARRWVTEKMAAALASARAAISAANTADPTDFVAWCRGIAEAEARYAGLLREQAAIMPLFATPDDPGWFELYRAVADAEVLHAGLAAEMRERAARAELARQEAV